MKTYKELNEVTNLNRSVEDIQSKIETIFKKLGGKFTKQNDDRIHGYIKFDINKTPRIELIIRKEMEHEIELKFSSGEFKSIKEIQEFDNNYKIIFKAYSELLPLIDTYNKINK
jgi:hypothetical protein